MQVAGCHFILRVEDHCIIPNVDSDRQHCHAGAEEGEEDEDVNFAAERTEKRDGDTDWFDVESITVVT